jgi:hypothetical protein
MVKPIKIAFEQREISPRLIGLPLLKPQLSSAKLNAT